MEGPQAFPRAARLTDAADYRYVFSDAIKLSDRYFVVLYRPGRGRGARLGLAIAKKRLRRAVDRNRVKRLVRERFRHWRARLGSRDLVVLARDGLAARDKATLSASLDRLFGQVAQDSA